MRRRVFYILGGGNEPNKTARVVSFSLASLISLNVAAVLLETVTSIQSEFAHQFQIFELLSIAIFSVEYCLRIWSCVEREEYKRPIIGRLRFVVSPLALIDLLAILPFYIPNLLRIDLRMLRALRLVRMLRILKLGRYSTALSTMTRVIINKREELTITIFLVSVLLIISSSLMYYLEHEAQPETFSSIPATLWWGVTTLTTVGYGDTYPITALGKFIGAVFSLLSIGIFALPTGIIGAGFMEEMRSKNNDSTKCPHCGKAIETK